MVCTFHGNSRYIWKAEIFNNESFAGQIPVNFSKLQLSCRCIDSLFALTLYPLDEKLNKNNVFV